MKKIIASTIALVLVVTSFATTITVTNTNDSGAGSLRQAAINAASGDTIRFDPGLLTAAVDSISLATEIDFGNKGIVIKGLYTATDTLFISGANTSRIFSFNGAGKVVLDSLVLINGNGQGNSSNGNGGAVFCGYGTDTLHVVNSIISNNSATEGGGISSSSSSSSSVVIVSNSTINNNSSNSFGGGIYSKSNGNYSSVTLSNSTICNNSVTNGGGGGIYSASDDDSSSVTVSNSTFSNNLGNTIGGGIYSFSDISSSSVTVSNSTFSDNSSNNGGVYVQSNSATSVDVISSIFAESSIKNNGSNSITSNGYNVFSDAPTGTVTTDQTNVTPVQLNLGPLQNNGGTTQTMLPGAGSVAIDAGNPNDMSDAQNRSVSGGIRDAGAAETTCIASSGMHNETVCFGDSIVVNGAVYDANNLTGTEVFTNVGPNNCDSTVTVSLTIENAIDVTTTTSGVSITANQTGATYQWIDCDNNNAIITGETSQLFTASVNGNYAVLVSVGNCSDTSDCVQINSVNLEELANNIKLNIYPNPATHTIAIEKNNLIINSISILSATGAVVKTIPGNTNSIDISQLTKGIYFIQCTTESGLISTKLIKE